KTRGCAHDRLTRPRARRRDPHRRRRLPHPRTFPVPDRHRALAPRKRGQPALPHRRWPRGQRPDQHRRLRRGHRRPAPAGDGAHRDRHLARAQRVRARDGLPLVATPRPRRGAGRPRRSPPRRPPPRRGHRGGRTRGCRPGNRSRRGPRRNGRGRTRPRPRRRECRRAQGRGGAMNWIVPLPVVVPLLAAGLALAFGRRPRLQALISTAALTGVFAASVALMVIADTSGPQVVNVGSWGAHVGIALVVDRLSALMLAVSALVILGVLLYSLSQCIADGSEGAALTILQTTYLVLAAGVANAFISGDLFNIYVGFEILLAASFVLLTLGGTGERIRAGSIYVVVSLLSSVLFLVAIAMIYAATGTVNLAHLSDRLADLPADFQFVLQALLLIAFLVKAAVFPMSAWLPDSYPTAPAPVTAVFAGLLTKVGVYAIIRTQTLLFSDARMDTILLAAAIVTMLVGIIGAVAQDDLKRLLSFTLVSHIGYMVFGVALATHMGLS